jgi:muramoyltetrapeptide carboxypeptidase LdcA involved in peptidoglycan recycling
MLSTTPVVFHLCSSSQRNHKNRSRLTKEKTDHKFVQYLFVIIIVLGPLYTRSQGHVQPKSSIPIGANVEISPKGFTLGVRANVQPKSSIPIGANVEISPKGFIH